MVLERGAAPGGPPFCFLYSVAMRLVSRMSQCSPAATKSKITPHCALWSAAACCRFGADGNGPSPLKRPAKRDALQRRAAKNLGRKTRIHSVVLRITRKHTGGSCSFCVTLINGIHRPVIEENSWNSWNSWQSVSGVLSPASSREWGNATEGS